MSNHAKILIHTALIHEAKPIIQYFNLVQNKTYEPLKIYENDTYLLVVAGMGPKKTNETLPFIFEQFKIKKAINMGIAGCIDKNVKLGTLFCTNHSFENIKNATITTVDCAIDDASKLNTLLVDMESDSFLNNARKNLEEENIFVFKIVSDYLSKEIPAKDFVYNSIKKSILKWENVINPKTKLK